MADNNDLPANMDLEAILRTLASLPKPEEQQPAHDQQQTYDQQQIVPDRNPLYQQPTDPRLVGRSTTSQLAPPKPQVRSSTALIDPATIIDWKSGLRCVSKIAAQNPEFSVSIRKLIKDQGGNVRQWEAGRARLIEEQALKKENEQKHRAALYFQTTKTYDFLRLILTGLCQVYWRTLQYYVYGQLHTLHLTLTDLATDT